MKVSLERLKTKAGRAWTTNRNERLVRIIGNGLFWRQTRSGYTGVVEEAGVYTFKDALDASAHCGAEKGIVYDFLEEGSGVITQEPRGKAMLLLNVK